MKITASEVEHVARLARLNLDAQEIARFQRELNSILDYMDLLNEVDTVGVEPTVHTQSISNALRQDELQPSQDLRDALANAPRQKDGSIVVPKVLE